MGHVFVNRTLNLKRVTHIGVDMDHTLVRYNSENFEAVAYKVMQDKLVGKMNYPKEVLELKFQFNRAIRGLVVDKSRGNLLKLSRFGAIRNSYHGLDPIDFRMQNKIYRSKYIDLGESNFDPVDTTFSVSFATLFAQVVDMKDKKPQLKLPDYPGIASDLAKALDEGHSDGSIKDHVKKNPEKFILRDKKMIAGIQRFKKHGKKFFVVTNSDFNYSKILLDYAINPFLKNETWEELFEFVICASRKPSFFIDRIPFKRIDPKTGKGTLHQGSLTPGVYEGGCANQFTEDLHLDPDQILYVGDHIYGDILKLKKSCGWRTALVVEELEHEVKAHQKAKPIEAQINRLMKQKVPIESQIDKLISLEIESKQKKNQKKIDALMKKIMAIDKKLSPLIKKNNATFNPYWGEVMRVGVEESYFAYQVERFACVYMAKLEDLLTMSPRSYFRSFYRKMPHEDV